ncbi:hypothetical protein BCR39DRAFT_380820 [Naematelia encephala]|uniref:Fork-head domain-containing protein n=1 Tax=Naematelia encephala TaxID=71784 RepID=A0A1Y2BCS7_9TREE|nr:hypothetical protein BCR39DRAFT_380820 [Naematelia encephala]
MGHPPRFHPYALSPEFIESIDNSSSSIRHPYEKIRMGAMISEVEDETVSPLSRPSFLASPLSLPRSPSHPLSVRATSQYVVPSARSLAPFNPSPTAVDPSARMYDYVSASNRSQMKVHRRSMIPDEHRNSNYDGAGNTSDDNEDFNHHDQRKWGQSDASHGLMEYDERYETVHKPDIPYSQMIRICISASPKKALTLNQHSVRHNLSINEQFLNLDRAVSDPAAGKGGYWIVVDQPPGKIHPPPASWLSQERPKVSKKASQPDRRGSITAKPYSVSHRSSLPTSNTSHRSSLPTSSISYRSSMSAQSTSHRASLSAQSTSYRSSPSSQDISHRSSLSSQSTSLQSPLSAQSLPFNLAPPQSHSQYPWTPLHHPPPATAVGTVPHVPTTSTHIDREILPNLEQPMSYQLPRILPDPRSTPSRDCGYSPANSAHVEAHEHLKKETLPPIRTLLEPVLGLGRPPGWNSLPATLGWR